MESLKKLITLPRRDVIKDKKGNIIEIVFDGSSYRKNELSINEFLEAGALLFTLAP